MKKFALLMIFALVFAYASLFFIKKPDGKPIRTLDSLLPEFSGDSLRSLKQEISDLKDNASEILESSRPAESAGSAGTAGAYYRWTDAEGKTHFGDRPPPGVDAELVSSAPLNVAPALQADNAETGTAGQDRVVAPGNLPAGADRALEVMQQAREVEELLQQSMKDREQALDQL